MKRILIHLGLGLLMVVMLLTACGQDASIRVASDMSTEGGLLSQMIILMLRANGFQVTDHSGLGTTMEVRDALLNNRIDIYPEYTGNGAHFFQGIDPGIWKDAQKGYEKVKELDRANNVVWLQPAPANNTWAIAIPRGLAEKEDMWSMEQFANYVNQGGYVKLMCSEEFLTDPFALPAFQEVYGFSLRYDQLLTQPGGNTAVTEKAAAEGTDGVNVAMAYGTDGYVDALDLVLLKDTKTAQPVYAPAPVVRSAVLERYPEIADILNKVFASLDQKTLQNLNSQTGFVGGEIAYLVARDYLIEKGFLTQDPSGFPTDLPALAIDLPDPTEQGIRLVDYVIMVEPDPLWHKTFEVNLETMHDVRVVGWFMASGGAFNDIKALVLNDVDFINWENRHEVEGLYKTDKLTIAKIDLPITASGRYHLVFDNRFSTFSNKYVLAKFYLYWSED